MSVPVIAFFNNKGGVGKTTLVYHVAWTMSDLGLRVVAADLDPQGNLSAAFLDDEQLERLWSQKGAPSTIFGAIQPIKKGTGDISSPFLEPINEHLALITGDMNLAQFEDDLSLVWPQCLDGDERAFRVISAFWRVIQGGGTAHKADVILVDLGPNLGSINRAALIASDYVVIPVGPDLFSIQGLKNLGPTLRQWRKGWEDRLKKNPDPSLELPKGSMRPLGYLVMQHAVRQDRPVKAYEKWIDKIPITYLEQVLGDKDPKTPQSTANAHCLALLKHYRSLMPIAQEARKPIFHLKPADGAMGSHLSAAQAAGKEFEILAQKIANQAKIIMP